MATTILKRYALLHNIFCVSANMIWQLSYLAKLYSLGILSISISLFYIVLIVGWVQEERVVMLHLWNL